jgi:uncharacterized damage-inducible protein DinB
MIPLWKRLLCIVAICAWPALSAQPAAQVGTLRSELLRDWLEMETTLVKVANEMPADKYGFKATPPQRDFAQQLLHIATANVVNLRFIASGGIEAPVINRNATGRADVLQAMDASFRYGETILKAQTDASLLEVVDTNQFLGRSTRARVLYFLLGHSWDIYGQMVVYLRLNGAVPPASQRP